MYPAACCIAPSPRFTAASDFRVGRRGKKIMAQEGEEAMTLDSALQELGMLSQASPLRSEYLNERERIKIGQGCIRPLYRVPCSSPQPDPNSESGSSSPLSSSLPNPSTLGLPRLSINSHFVTSITLGSEQVDREARQRRLSGPPGPWPRRTRILTSPYLYLPRLPGFLPSPTHRHRCRVRFQEPVLSWRQREVQPPLEEDISAQLEGIRLETGTVPNLMPSSIVPSLTSQVNQMQLEGEEASIILSEEETP